MGSVEYDTVGEASTRLPAGPGAPAVGSQAYVRLALEQLGAACSELRVGPTHPSSAVSLADARVRGAVRAFVQRMRDEGAPAERALVMVKSTIRDTSLPQIDPNASRALMESLVRHGIEAFYDRT